MSNDKMTPAPSPRGTNHENLWVRTSLIARDRSGAGHRADDKHQQQEKSRG